jgi:hypothetical protein
MPSLPGPQPRSISKTPLFNRRPQELRGLRPYTLECIQAQAFGRM